MVHVVLDKEGIVPSVAEERLVVGESHDMFGQYIVRRYEVRVYIVVAVVARAVHRVVHIEVVMAVQGIVCVDVYQGHRPLVVAHRALVSRNFVARTYNVVAVPVVLAVGGIYG